MWVAFLGLGFGSRYPPVVVVSQSPRSGIVEIAESTATFLVPGTVLRLEDAGAGSPGLLPATPSHQSKRCNVCSRCKDLSLQGRAVCPQLLPAGEGDT